VSSIIAPFGEPIEARPPVPTEEERIAEREAKKRIKDERRGKTKVNRMEDGVEVKTEGEVLESVQKAREEDGSVKGVQP
jgi:small subunit ribosomal protein S17